MTEAKEQVILTYHFHKEKNDKWIFFSEWGGDTTYTPEIFEQYIRPHISVASGERYHLFYSGDFSMDTVGYGRLPARLAIHFVQGEIKIAKVAFGGLDPLGYGVPVNQFTLRLPLMEGIQIDDLENEELDPVV